MWWAAPVLLTAAAAQDVAHCIVAGFRTLGDPDVHVKMRENFIDGVGGATVELFLYVDLGVELSAKGSWYAHTQTELDRAAHYLQSGFDLSTVAPTPPPRVYKVTIEQHRHPPDVGVRCGEACTGQFYKWVRCYDMVIVAETRRGKRFDWIIRHRPDMLWHKKARPIATFPLEPFWNVDHQLYLPRSELDAARAIGDVACDGCEKTWGQRSGLNRRAKSCWCLNAKVLKTLNTTIKSKMRSTLFGRPSTRAPPRLGNASMFSNDFKRTPEAQELLDAVGEQALHGRTVKDALRRKATGEWVARGAEDGARPMGPGPTKQSVSLSQGPPRSSEPTEQGVPRRRLPRPRKPRPFHREKTRDIPRLRTPWPVHREEKRDLPRPRTPLPFHREETRDLPRPRTPWPIHREEDRDREGLRRARARGEEHLVRARGRFSRGGVV